MRWGEKMRELKFRAWDEKLERMLTGHNQYGTDEPDPNKKYSSAGAFTRLWESIARFKESRRFILTQYTGLRDKDGVEIYEGDILTDEDTTKPSVVKYDDGFYEFDGGCIISDGESKVIGNIYENPELLKEI